MAVSDLFLALSDSPIGKSDSAKIEIEECLPPEVTKDEKSLRANC